MAQSKMKTQNFEMRFQGNISGRKSSCEEHESKPKDGYIRWYTDGSSASYQFGAGVYVFTIKKIYFPKHVNDVRECVRRNLGRNLRNKTIVILSDSQLAVKAIESTNINSRLAKETMDLLKTLGGRSSGAIRHMKAVITCDFKNNSKKLLKRKRGQLKPQLEILAGHTPFTCK